MPTPEHGDTGLRLATPTLEPDPLFLHQLASLAAESGAVSGSAPATQDWKIALAAASVAAIATGGAWAAGAFSGSDSPTPPGTPVTRPSDPLTTATGTPTEEARTRHPASEPDPPGTATDDGTSAAHDQQSPPPVAPASASAPADSTGSQGNQGDQNQGDDPNPGQGQGQDDGGDGADHSGSDGQGDGDQAEPPDDESGGSGPSDDGGDSGGDSGGDDDGGDNGGDNGGDDGGDGSDRSGVGG
ncbi:MAG: hypothetical protein JWN22_1695 [Nocardioides sp.]|jgi:hypothetical protein|nr:hypothetical protein [Nocardioides sp.]